MDETQGVGTSTRLLELAVRFVEFAEYTTLPTMRDRFLKIADDYRQRAQAVARNPHQSSSA